MEVQANLAVAGPLDQALGAVQDSVCLWQIHRGGKNNAQVVIAADPTQVTRKLTCPTISNANPPRFDQLPEPDKGQVSRPIPLARTAATAKIAELVKKAGVFCDQNRDLPACKTPGP
jgi:hypothetical protein